MLPGAEGEAMSVEVRAAVGWTAVAATAILVGVLLVAPGNPGLGIMLAFFGAIMAVAMYDKGRHGRLMAAYRLERRASLRVAVCPDCVGFGRLGNDGHLACPMFRGEGVLR